MMTKPVFAPFLSQRSRSRRRTQLDPFSRQSPLIQRGRQTALLVACLSASSAASPDTMRAWILQTVGRAFSYACCIDSFDTPIPN